MTRFGKVLVVDDDKQRADIVRLRLCGDFEIVNAPPGATAERLLETETFELLISGQGQTDTELVGSSAAMRQLLSALTQAAADGSDLHLVGEAGSGKATVARAVHHKGTRSGAFLRVRLSELDTEQMAAAVFCSVPAGGTLFLDGIEMMPPSLQERLALARSADKARDYQLITASTVAITHPSLSAALREQVAGESSTTIVIEIPSLRDRGEDIPRLAIHFLAEASRQCGRAGLRFGRQAMAELCAYDWPGNVTELRSTIHDVVLRTSDESEIGPGTMVSGGKSLIVEQVVGDIIGGSRGLDAAMAELEAAVIREALQQQRGNRSAAARQLKLPRQTLQDRMKKHGLWS